MPLTYGRAENTEVEIWKELYDNGNFQVFKTGTMFVVRQRAITYCHL